MVSILKVLSMFYDRIQDKHLGKRQFCENNVF
jgi:hypothetical protein